MLRTNQTPSAGIMQSRCLSFSNLRTYNKCLEANCEASDSWNCLQKAQAGKAGWAGFLGSMKKILATLFFWTCWWSFLVCLTSLQQLLIMLLCQGTGCFFKPFSLHSRGRCTNTTYKSFSSPVGEASLVTEDTEMVSFMSPVLKSFYFFHLTRFPDKTHLAENSLTCISCARQQIALDSDLPQGANEKVAGTHGVPSLGDLCM